MQPSAQDPSAYIATLPAGRRELIAELDGVIAELLQGHSRVLWRGRFWGGSERVIIGYGELSTRLAPSLGLW